MGIAIDNLDAKAKANGWTKAYTNDLKLLELNRMKAIAQKAVEGSVQSAGVLGDMVRQSEGNYDEMFTWVATGNSKGGICPTCEDLNQTVKPMTDWLDFGLPGNAPTYCTVHCVCELIKSSEAVKNPVIIERDKPGVRGGKGKLIAVYEKTGTDVTKE